MPPKTIFGPNGEPITRSVTRRPLRASNFFESGNRSNQWGDNLQWHYQNGFRDSQELLSVSNWRQMVSMARFLFGNTSILRGALLEQATFSFPLKPQYVGTDADFGRLAEQWLWEWRRVQNIKGPNFDSLSTARMRLIGRKVDGDIGTILTKQKNSDFPAIQLIRAHRIGTRNAWGIEEITAGRYRGNHIHNGVIYNKDGRAIAYRVLGDALDGSEDRDYSARNMFLSFRPDYPDQIRGQSEMVSSLNDFGDIKRLRSYEMRSQHIQSSYAIVEKNEEGEAPPGVDYVTTGADGEGTFDYRTYEGGLHQYFRSTTPGNGLELLAPDRPGANSQAFEDRIICAAFYGIEWDPNFALAIKEPGGAWARTIIEKVRRSITVNQRIEEMAQRREDGYALSVAIKEGILPTPKDFDWFAWEYQPPARLTADSGNEENAKRENYKLGLTTAQDYAAEKGRNWLAVRRQRETETRDLLDRARNIQKDFPELSLSEALALLEQRTPNAAATSAGATTSLETPSTEP